MSGFTLACVLLKVQYKLDVTGVTDTTSRIWIIHAFVLKCIIHSIGTYKVWKNIVIAWQWGYTQKDKSIISISLLNIFEIILWRSSTYIRFIQCPGTTNLFRIYCTVEIAKWTNISNIIWGTTKIFHEMTPLSICEMWIVYWAP